MATQSAHWFCRFVWLGILANLSLAFPALLVPEWLQELLGLEPSPPAIWLRNVGMLLVALSAFYIPAAIRPLDHKTNALLLVAARLFAAAFWFWMIFILGFPRNLLPLLLTDLILGVVQGLLLVRVLRTTRS